MLDRILPRAHPTYRSMPIWGRIVDEFSQWCHRRGYTLHSLGDKLRDVRYLAHFFARRGLRSIKEIKQEHLETAWQRLHKQSRTFGGTIRQLRQFLQQVHGLAQPAPQPRTPVENEVKRYAGYLQHVRGCAEGTIRAHLSCVRAFLGFLGYPRSASTIAPVTLPQIEAFVRAQAKTRHRSSLQNRIGQLRGWLRFQHTEGILPHPLHAAIDTPRVYRLEPLPRALPWSQVQALLRSINRSEPQGLRDYTILFLMAAYGLRSSEVVTLTLDDLEWCTGTLRVAQRKTRQCLTLPLTDEVGDVLQRYLQKGRPSGQGRALFLHQRAPSGPLAAATITTLLRRRIRRSGLAIRPQGTYCLRHAFAVELLRQGVGMPTIGKILGHRHVQSTAVYLRLAIDELRGVSLPVPPSVSRPVSLKPGWKAYRPQVRRAGGLAYRAPTRFRSGLGPALRDYLATKQALGRRFYNETRTLLDWDWFLYRHQRGSRIIGPNSFSGWVDGLAHLNPSVRRHRMRIVRNFLVFHARDHAVGFIPDLATFPKALPPRPPRLVSTGEMASVLAAATQLEPSPDNPIRAQTIQIALVLLFCCGLRRGELLRLQLAHFDREQNLLRIEATKFHKSRLVPLSPSVSRKLRDYVELRRRRGLPVEPESFLFWNRRRAASPAGSAVQALTLVWQRLCLTVGLLDERGRPPRLHDLRHSYIINALQHLYAQGKDVQSKLPHLSAYVGHVSPVSTHYYLQLTPELRQAASQRFHQCCQSLFEQGGVR